MSSSKNRRVRRSIARPIGRSDSRRPGTAEFKRRPFERVLEDLATTRREYEELRTSSGPLAERARLVSQLHELRAEASRIRNHLL